MELEEQQKSFLLIFVLHAQIPWISALYYALGGDRGTEREDVRDKTQCTQKGSISEEERESSAFQKESNLMFIILMCHYKQQNISFTDICMAFQADFSNKGKLLI